MSIKKCVNSTEITCFGNQLHGVVLLHYNLRKVRLYLHQIAPDYSRLHQSPQV